MPIVRTLTVLTVLASFAATAEAQKVHKIRFEVDRQKEIYRFSPATVTASPGDVLLFKVVNGAPHSITFDTTGLSSTARAALSAALGRRSGELGSPMLAKNGAEYKVVLPKLPAGTYTYFCLPYRAYDMRGKIIVKK